MSLKEQPTYISDKTGEQVEGSVNIFNIRSDSSENEVLSYLPEGKYPILSTPLQTVRSSTPLSKQTVNLGKVLNNKTSADSISPTSRDDTWPTAGAAYRFFKNNYIHFNIQHVKLGVRKTCFIHPEFILIPDTGYRIPDSIDYTNLDCHYNSETGVITCTLPLNELSSSITAEGVPVTGGSYHE